MTGKIRNWYGVGDRISRWLVKETGGRDTFYKSVVWRWCMSLYHRANNTASKRPKQWLNYKVYAKVSDGARKEPGNKNKGKVTLVMVLVFEHLVPGIIIINNMVNQGITIRHFLKKSQRTRYPITKRPVNFFRAQEGKRWGSFVYLFFC